MLLILFKVSSSTFPQFRVITAYVPPFQLAARWLLILVKVPESSLGMRFNAAHKFSSGAIPLA